MASNVMQLGVLLLITLVVDSSSVKRSVNSNTINTPHIGLRSSSISILEAHKLAQLVANKYKSQGYIKNVRVVRVHKATATATGGRHLEVELGETDCDKDKDEAINCQVNPTKENGVCIVDFDNAHTITSFYCQDLEDYHRIMEIYGNSNTPDTQQLAQLVRKEYNIQDNDDEYYEVVKIHRATASGTGGYHLEVELGKTNCNKHRHLATKCQVDPTEETIVCIVDFDNAHTITTFYCQDMEDYLLIVSIIGNQQ